MSSDEPAPALSARKMWRVARAVYLVLVKGLGKHQPKLAALGVQLHHLLSKRHGHHHDGGLDALRDHPALTYLSSLSCRSMDPVAAAVHPCPRGGGISSLSCRSMDPAAAVCQYQYRPREVEFSCSSTPLHRRRRRAQRRMRLQHDAGHDTAAEQYGSAAAVTRLFELMDVKEDAEDADGDVAESVVTAPAPRQVRITDSPFPARDDGYGDDDEGRGGVVDRRADEFIMWFHEQLRLQQQQRGAAARELGAGAYYLVR